MRDKNVKLEKLNRYEIYRYLGYKKMPENNEEDSDNTPNNVIRGIIDKCEETLIAKIKPAYVSREFKINQYMENNEACGVDFLDTDLTLLGQDICRHLKDCNSAILLCATLSEEADRLIRQTEIKDMSEALIMDTIASVAIEQVCEKAEKSIKENFDGKYFTYRYGVGYGDLSLDYMGKIITMLNADKLIGLKCSENNILTPRKSVVCIMGVSDIPLKKGQKGCITCNMRDRCNYRKQGLNCNYD